MTKEEATKELIRAFDVLDNSCHMDNRRKEAFNKAYVALKAEPCEDAISRQAMLDGLASIAKVKARSDAQKSLMGRVMFFTEQLPRVTPKITECGDAVSREAVLEVVKNPLNIRLNKIIEELPPVTPKPKTGKWIKVTNGRGGHECSLCHEYAPSYQNGDEWLTKYCPDCGAKMEGVSE